MNRKKKKVGWARASRENTRGVVLKGRTNCKNTKKKEPKFGGEHGATQERKNIKRTNKQQTAPKPKKKTNTNKTNQQQQKTNNKQMAEKYKSNPIYPTKKKKNIKRLSPTQQHKCDQTGGKKDPSDNH